MRALAFTKPRGRFLAVGLSIAGMAALMLAGILFSFVAGPERGAGGTLMLLVSASRPDAPDPKLKRLSLPAELCLPCPYTEPPAG